MELIQKISEKIIGQQNVERIALNVATLGVVDYKNGEYLITNPIITIGKEINNLRQNSEVEGVWIGQRSLKQLGVNIEIMQINHWCVKIDNIIFSLTTDTGSADGVIQIHQTNDNNNYNFIYYNKTKQNIQTVKQYVEYINYLKIDYKLLSDNCQFYSQKIAEFATSENLNLSEIYVLSLQKEQELKQLRFSETFSLSNIFQNNITSRKQFMINNNIISLQEFINQQNNLKNQKYNMQPQRRLQTIGQLSKDNYKTIGYMNSNNKIYQTPNYIRMFDYGNSFLEKNLRQQQSQQQYQSLSNQQRFNLFGNPIQSTGFSREGMMQATVRKGIFKKNNDVSKQIQSFQNINYNSARENLLSMQPFQNKYQMDRSDYVSQLEYGDDEIIPRKQIRSEYN